MTTPAADPVDAPIVDLPRTIAELPFFAAGRFQKPDLLGRCVGGAVSAISGRELVDRVRDLSLGFSAQGVAPGDRVALLAESRPEWLFADLGILTAGAVTVPIYPTLSADQVKFILRDSDASAVVVSSAQQLEKVRAVASDLLSLRLVITMDGAAGSDWPTAARLMTLEDVAATGHQRIVGGWGVGREFQERALSISPDDLATIIYTSGTTGTPKGVRLTHGNLAANIRGVLSVLDLNQHDTALSFLPLCHAFERTVAYVLLASGVSMVFAESLDTIARDLMAVRPTVMSGVPRVFEKLEARVLERGLAARGLSRRIFRWSLDVANGLGERREALQPLPWSWRLRARLADKYVFSRVRESLGGRLRWAVSGGAPLNPRLGRFFLGLGLPILEGYGLTETSPVISVMPLSHIRFGTVGPPLPNVTVRIADDGEILVSGPSVSAGYHGREADTGDAMRDGWFHTGDIGRLDEHGYLQVTDRKKEVLVTSGGKKIAPQPIEESLRADPLVAEAVLIGEGRHFPAALLVPDFTALAARLEVPSTAVRDRLSDAGVRALYETIVDRANASLAQFERIKKFELLSEEFSAATGELTPTLKVKRRVIAERYALLIERIYQDKY